MEHRTIERRPLTRREFIKATAAAGTVAALLQPGRAGAADAGGARHRYALVGTGGRSAMYRGAVDKTYADHAEMVGYCDTNRGRLELAQRESREVHGRDIPLYAADDFDKMVRETRPDTVIVTTVDGFHHQYIVRAMELGCDVITEKPMTTDEKKCRAIIDTQRKTGRRCRVTFNVRYSPPRTQVKDLLMKGVIGDILSVDFHWMLNTHHGADYFRRWHSQKKFSGGLMVHKATHHFDLVNWWLSAAPQWVSAIGKRDFYTPAMARRMGLTGPHERCLTCPEKEKCGFYLDLAANAGMKKLYLDNEQYDGYYRDRCVFRPSIDIEDSMNLLVRYDTGVMMSYSLNAFCSWEGYVVSFNGTKGRLEHKAQESVYLFGDTNAPGAVEPEGTWTRVFPLREPAYEVEVWSGEGAHGGGDAVMLDDIFLPEPPADPYMRRSDQRGGAASILIGIAANNAMKSGKPVEIADLVPKLERPDFPPMPGHDGPVPMPGIDKAAAS